MSYKLFKNLSVPKSHMHALALPLSLTNTHTHSYCYIHTTAIFGAVKILSSQTVYVVGHKVQNGVLLVQFRLANLLLSRKNFECLMQLVCIHAV
jgi:hypothetical protein